MPENEAQNPPAPAANQSLADDEPDPTVKAPRPVWILKSYNPGGNTRNGEQETKTKD